MKDPIIETLKCSEIAKPRTIEKVFSQVVEETGEISTAIFRPEKAQEVAFDEVVDAIVAAIDLAYLLHLKDHPGSSIIDVYNRIAEVQERKCKKWIS